MISFKGHQFPRDMILFAVYFYVRCTVSYCDLEDITAERGVSVDHAALNRWVVKFSSSIATEAHRRKSSTSRSWRMDETYVRVRGKWAYLYRAVDKFGKTLGSVDNKAAAAVEQTLEFMLSVSPVRRWAM